MTPYPSRPVSLLITLTRLAGVGAFFVGIAFCVLMIATTTARADATYRADSYDEATHRAHMMELREWEGRYARGETFRLARVIAQREAGDFPTHRARVRYVLSLADEVNALLALTRERESALAAGFCSAEEAEESSAYEALELLREAASALRLEVTSLAMDWKSSTSPSTRRKVERSEVERFFKAAASLEAKITHGVIIVDAFYQMFTTPEIENESCRGIYGTDAFAAEREQVFYTPTFGVPLPPKEE